MPWIELHQNILRHPKLIRLSVRLAVKKQYALWYLLSLWLWSLDYADKGDLSGFGPAEIAEAADWSGDPDKFLDALQDARWMDGMALHDWMDYAGRLVEQREANKERMRERRAMHVQNTTTKRVALVGGLPNQPNLTNQPTKPNQPEYVQLFEQIRVAYPGKKKGLEQEWRGFERKNRKRIKDILPLVLEGVCRYKAEIVDNGTETRFVKHFATWLNQECWTEEAAHDSGRREPRKQNKEREYDERIQL